MNKKNKETPENCRWAILRGPFENMREFVDRQQRPLRPGETITVPLPKSGSLRQNQRERT